MDTSPITSKKLQTVRLQENLKNRPRGSQIPGYCTRNPLEIAGVLDCLFGFLPLEDIKRCRLVSREWNEVAEPFLRKLARISFGGDAEESAANKSPSNFKKTFRNSGTQMQFTSFGLKRFDFRASYWTLASVKKIFEFCRPSFANLKLENIWTSPHLNDFSNLVSPLNITVLSINAHLWSQVSLSLDSIIHVKYLRLNRCSLRLINGIKISPVEIDLKNCQISFPNGNGDHCINEFIGFDNMRLCTIHMSVHSINHPLFINLVGSVELEALNLVYITLCNWAFSNWKVAKCVLERVNGAIGNSTIGIHDMQFRNCRMSLRDIPKSVETLTLYKLENFNSLVSEHLPNLKYMKLFIPLSDIYIQCRNLVALELNLFDRRNTIALNTIPDCLRKLKINGDYVYCQGELAAHLDTVVLNGLILPSILDVMSKVVAQNVVFKFCSFNTQLRFRNDDEALEYLRKGYNSLAMGPFIWTTRKQDRFCRPSELENIVKVQSEFYLFKDKNPSAIEKADFEKLMVL